MSARMSTENPRAFGVVLSSVSEWAGDLIAGYAPAFGAAVDLCGRIQVAQPGIRGTIVRLRGDGHPTRPGEYTDAKGRTPEMIARDWRCWSEGVDA